MRFRLVSIALLACSALMFLAAPGWADSVTYTIFKTSPSFQVSDCTFGAGPGTYSVIATLNLSQPAKSLQFSSPPTCSGPGFSWSYPVSGDPNSLLVMDFGGCISGSVQIYAGEFSVDGCCPNLLNGPATGGSVQDSPPVLIGCDDQPRYLIPPCSAGEPQSLTPVNGTTTPLSPFLSWDYGFGNYCEGGIGVVVYDVLYGTDPLNLDLSFSTQPPETPSATLQGLLPNTQYYWQVRVTDDYAHYTGSRINFSLIQTFTTEGAVPAEQTTWGGIKALYVD